MILPTQESPIVQPACGEVVCTVEQVVVVEVVVRWGGGVHRGAGGGRLLRHSRGRPHRRLQHRPLDGTRADCNNFSKKCHESSWHG